MQQPDFKASTDKLGLAAEDLAKALGVSAQSIRQMRADPASTAFRTPPAEWKRVVGRLARSRALDLLNLANALLRDE